MLFDNLVAVSGWSEVMNDVHHTRLEKIFIGRYS